MPLRRRTFLWKDGVVRNQRQKHNSDCWWYKAKGGREPACHVVPLLPALLRKGWKFHNQIWNYCLAPKRTPIYLFPKLSQCDGIRRCYEIGLHNSVIWFQMDCLAVILILPALFGGGGGRFLFCFITVQLRHFFKKNPMKGEHFEASIIWNP